MLPLALLQTPGHAYENVRGLLFLSVRFRRPRDDFPTPPKLAKIATAKWTE